MKESHQQQTDSPTTPQSRRFIVPLEDIVMPVLFGVAIMAALFVCRRWLGLPFWGACLLGFPAGFALVFGILWLLSFLWKPRR
jgi:hypothetical protein